MTELDFEKRDYMRIRVTNLDNGGYIETQTVEANLMYAILEKLEEMRCAIIDVEDAVNPR